MAAVLVAWIALCMTCSPLRELAPPAAKGTTIRPTFVLGGGGCLPEEAYERFMGLAGGGRIVVIPSASSEPEASARGWERHKAVVVHAASRREALNPSLYKPIEDASGVWFSGGDQLRLYELYHDTPLIKALHRLLARGGVVGGTSAGASIVSDVMVYEDAEARGFGLTPIVIDQHFGTRHRLKRLRRIITRHAGLVGVGIDEDTAIVIRDDQMEVIGPGNATVCSRDSTVVYRRGEKIAMEPPRGRILIASSR
jgi:cyanophycinase